MSNSSSNADDTVDDAQRILDQYPPTPPGKGGVHSSSSNGERKGGSRRRIHVQNEESRITTTTGARQLKKKSKIILQDLRAQFPHIFEALISLSRDNFVYFGFYGYGSTRKYLRSQTYHGTQAILDSQQGKRTSLELKILESLAYEGSVFATYDSLILHIRKTKEAEQYG